MVSCGDGDARPEHHTGEVVEQAVLVALRSGEEVSITGAGYPAFFENVSVGVEDVGAAQFAAGGGVGGHVDDFLGEEGV